MNNPLALLDSRIRLAAQRVFGVQRAAGRVPMPDWPVWLKHLDFNLSEEQLESPQAFAMIPDIYACVSILQDAIAALPVVFYTTDLEGNETIIERGNLPLVDLFLSGNKLDTGYDVWHSLIGHFMLNGNGYLFFDYSDVNPFNAKAVGNKLLPSSVWALPSHLVTVVLGDNRTIENFKLWTGGIKPVTIPPEQVLHVPDFGTEPNGVGMSRLSPLNLTYHTQRDAERYQRELFKRGGMTAGVYATDQALGVEERARVREDLMVEGEGPENYFRPVLLPKGLKWIRSGLTQQELQYLEVGEWNTHKVCRVFKVPASLLGIRVGGMGASDKGIEQDMLLLIRLALQPITRRIEERMNEHLFARRFGLPGLKIRFDYSNEHALQSVFLSQADAYQKATGRPILTVNEARTRMGLPPHEDPSADLLFSPMLQAEHAAETAAKHEPPPNDNPAQRALLPVATILRDEREERLSLQRVAADAQLERWIAVATPRITRLFSQQRKRVADRLRALAERVEVKEGSDTRFARVLDLDVLLTVLDNESDRALVRKLLRMIRRGAGDEAIREVAADLVFSVDASRASAALKEQGLDMLTNINATTREALLRSLSDGLAAHESTSELIERSNVVFDGRRKGVARIARTEANTAINSAKLEGWRQGVEQLNDGDVPKMSARKRWLASKDEAVRGTPGGPYDDSQFSHYHADGQEVDLDQPFLVGAHSQGKGEACMAPGDAKLSVGNRANCRCTMLLILDRGVDSTASLVPIDVILSR